jgi:hypothetical protein
MTYLRVLICRVADEDDEQMTALAHLDLPDAPAVRRALHVLQRTRPGADAEAVDSLCAYLQVRAAWIPDYRARRRQRRYNGNGLGAMAIERHGGRSGGGGRAATG